MARTLRKHYGWTFGVLASLAFAGWHAFALAGNPPQEMPVDDLVDILNKPTVYSEREVAFYCRFAKVGKLFKEINTRYNSDTFVNVAVWPHQARLWEDEGRRQLLPTLYIDKRDLTNLDQLRQAQRYDLMLVRGSVTGTYGSMPWITVRSIERFPVAEDMITDASLAQLRRGFELLNGDNPRMAANHLQEALALGVPRVHRSYVNAALARCWRDAGFPLRALEPLRNLSAELPNDPAPFFALAEAELAAGNVDAAIVAARQTLERTPRFGPAQSLLGEAYGRQGLHAQGLEMIGLAAADPNLHPRERAMLDVRRARIFVLARRYADAVQAYVRTISEGSPLAGEPWLRREIASLYEERFEATGKPELLDDAISEFKNANAFAPRGDAASLVRAAEAEYNRALKRSPGNPDLTPVHELLAAAEALRPAYPPARALTARLLYVQGDTERANAIFNDLLAECANDPVGLMAIADAFDAIGRGAAACDLYRRVLEMEPWNRRASERRDRIQACAAPAGHAQRQWAAQAPTTTTTTTVFTTTVQPVTATLTAVPLNGGVTVPSMTNIAPIQPTPVDLNGLGIVIHNSGTPTTVGNVTALAPALPLSTFDSDTTISGPANTFAPVVVPASTAQAPAISTWYLTE